MGPRTPPSTPAAPLAPIQHIISHNCRKEMRVLDSFATKNLGGAYREGRAERVHVLSNAQVLAPLRVETDDW
jgi:hypothetical protein